MPNIKWVIVAELLLDTGPEYVSGERVRRGEIIYSGTVERWGSIQKGISAPSGMPQIGNASIRISDNYRHWRNLLATQTPRRRIMRITVLPAGASISAYAPVYEGEVVDVAFTPAAIEISLMDRTYAWLDEPIPAMAVKEIFPNISEHDEGGFIPIVSGNCWEPNVSPFMPQGVIPLPHIGMVDGVDRWAAAATPILTLILYRRQTTSVDAAITTPEWVLVPQDEYTLSEQVIAAIDNPYGSFEMTFTHVDFYEQQPDGTEIRGDIFGIKDRGAWGTLSPAGTSPPTALRNPIDFFINMTFFVMQKAGVSTDVFDTAEIAALREEIEALGLEDETLGLYCDGAITEPITCREWLGQFLPCFNLDMYVNRRGKITLARTNVVPASPALVPIFKEGTHILRDTFTERLPEKVVTQLQYRFEYNNATGRFADSTIATTAEQALLNLPGDIEKIEKDVVDLFYIRYRPTAETIITERLLYLALGAFRQQFEMSMPATLNDVELARLCGLTHSMGLAVGGYVGQQAKILNVTLDLDRLVYKLETILYPPAVLS